MFIFDRSRKLIRMNFEACLPPVVSNSYPGTDSNVYAAGWGTLYSGSTFKGIYFVKIKF